MSHLEKVSTAVKFVVQVAVYYIFDLVNSVVFLEGYYRFIKNPFFMIIFCDKLNNAE